MNAYFVEYKMHSADRVRGIPVSAKNKENAWDKATFDLIPQKEGNCPFSSWVKSVTYNNGNYRAFNTFEGKPY